MANHNFNSCWPLTEQITSAVYNICQAKNHWSKTQQYSTFQLKRSEHNISSPWVNELGRENLQSKFLRDRKILPSVTQCNGMLNGMTANFLLVGGPPQSTLFGMIDMYGDQWSGSHAPSTRSLEVNNDFLVFFASRNIPTCNVKRRTSFMSSDN